MSVGRPGVSVPARGTTGAMRVVVVGASGNVGTALLRRSAAEPDRPALAGVARRPPDASNPPYDAVDWTALDIGSPEAPDRLRAVFDGADAVVCLAWLLQPSHDQRALERTNVTGSRQVFTAAAAAGVPHLIYVSSVGAYSPGPKDEPVDETWPTDGVPASSYSRHKAAVERILDTVEREHPGLAVARVRPGLVFQRDAGSEISRYFLGPLAPVTLLRWRRVPLLPDHPRLVAQVVHADDLAAALAAVLRRRATGAFNVASEPVLSPSVVAPVLHGRTVRMPAGLLRGAAALTWRARLQPTEPGWIDLALAAPVMDTTRARTELGWAPSHSAIEALEDLLAGMSQHAGTSSAPMRPRRWRHRGVASR